MQCKEGIKTMVQSYQKKLFLNFLNEQAPKYEELVSSIFDNTIYCMDSYFHNVLSENLDNIYENNYYLLFSIKKMLAKQVDYVRDIIEHCNIPNWLPIEEIINNCEVNLLNGQIVKCNGLILYTESSLKELVSVCAPVLNTACSTESLINVVSLLMSKSNFKKSSGEEACIIKLPYQP